MMGTVLHPSPGVHVKPLAPLSPHPRAARRSPRPAPPPSVLVLCAVAFLAACAADDPAEPDDRIVAGVDLDALFASPSQSEIDAVLADWAGRSPASAGVQFETSVADSILEVAVTVSVVSHVVDGNRHYGALIAPEGAAPRSLPVVMYLHGGDGGFAVEDVFAIAELAPDLTAQVIWVAPSFRSEPLRYQGATFTSEGTPSPWDRDVDDALALLDVVADTVFAADTGRVGLVGLSRGAGVALLMAEREPSIDVVVEFFGPTDFFGEFIQDVVEDALLGDIRDLPGLEFLNAEFIVPLREGDIAIPAVRGELVRRSAVLFADRLPDLQVHHGGLDTVVEVSQAASLIATMQDLGRGSSDLCPPADQSGLGASPLFEACIYPTGSHNAFTLDGSIPRAEAFLERLFQP